MPGSCARTPATSGSGYLSGITGCAQPVARIRWRCAVICENWTSPPAACSYANGGCGKVAGSRFGMRITPSRWQKAEGSAISAICARSASCATVRQPRHCEEGLPRGRFRKPGKRKRERPLRRLFLKQFVEGVPCIARAAGGRRVETRRGTPGRASCHLAPGHTPRHIGRRPFARNSDARRKEPALIGLILQRDSNRDGPCALKASRRLKMGALLAAMERHSAFRARATERGAGRQHGGATVTARRRHSLHQARQARARYIKGRARSRRLLLRASRSAVTVVTG